MAFRAVELYNDGQTANDSDGLITGALPGQEGDVVVLGAVINSGVATMTLTDDGDAGNTWTTISSPEPDVLQSSMDVYVWAKALTATDVGATVTIDASVGAVRFVGVGVAFSGRDPTIANLITARTTDTSTSTTLDSLGVTTGADDYDVVNLFFTHAGTLTTESSLTDPDGLTLAGDCATNMGASPNLSVAATYVEDVIAGSGNGASTATFNQDIRRGIIYSVGIPPGAGASLSETPADDLDAADTVALTHGRLPADDEALTDSATITQGRLPADDVDLTDSATITQGRLPADDVDLTDSATTVGTFERAEDDDLGLTDSVSAVAGQFLDDSLGLTDSVTLGFSGVTFDDSSDLADAVALTFDRVPADDLGLTDSVAVQCETTLEPSDDLGLTDSVATTGTFFVSISDALGLLDATGDLAPGYLPGLTTLASDGLSTAVLAEASLSTAELLDQHGAAVLANSVGTSVIDT